MTANDSSAAAGDDPEAESLPRADEDRSGDDALECTQGLRAGTLADLLGTNDDEIDFKPERLGLTARTPEL